MKVSKNLLPKYYQENNKRQQKKKKKKTRESYQNLSTEEKGKNDNIVVNVTKISQKMKKKEACWVLKKKYYRVRKKCLIKIIRNYYFKK